MDVFAVFEGGGAKGLAHVGALRAAEQRNFKFRAVAGTSIGALIAALVAAGFTSHDLFHLSEGEERGLFSSDLERLFMDEVEYARVERLRRHIRVALRQPAPDGFQAYIRGHLMSRLSLTWAAAVVVANVSVVPLLLHRAVVGDLWWQAGAVGTEKLRKWINETLRVKLGLPEDAKVRFDDLPIELRVVATDLTRDDMQVFGSRSTPETSVADAVGASMAYPLFFKPVQLGDSIYVDGGLASNGPAWVLDDLRDTADTRIPTFAFRLLDPVPVSSTDAVTRGWWVGRKARECLRFAPKASGRRPRFTPLAKRLVTSSLASRSFLESRRIHEFHLIELRAGLSTLDFDVVNANKARTVEQGEVGVSEYLSRKIGPRDPGLMEKALRAFAALLKRYTNDDGIVRAYILQPTDSTFGRVVYSAMLEDDADDAIVVRLDTRSQALCLSRREPVLMKVSAIASADRVRASTKYLHAARPAAVTHAICVPIFPSMDEWVQSAPDRRADPMAALCFDFRTPDGEYLLLEPWIEDLLTAVAQAVGEFWTGMPISGTGVLTEEAGSVSADWIAIEDAPGFFVSARKIRHRVGNAVNEEINKAISRVGGDKGDRLIRVDAKHYKIRMDIGPR